VIKGRSVLAVVSANSGSRGLARRDLSLLGGKALVAWSIEAARSSRLIDRVIVATADLEVAQAASQMGAEVPFRAADPGDEGGYEDFIDQARGGSRQSGILNRWGTCAAEALHHLPQFDIVVLLDVAAPLRATIDIDCAIEICARHDGAPVVTVSEARVLPQSLVVLDGARRMQPLLRQRSENPGGEPMQSTLSPEAKLYVISSAIAVVSRHYLQNSGYLKLEEMHAYILPAERALLIERKTDLSAAEGIIQRMGLTDASAPTPFAAAPPAVQGSEVPETRG